ncbi:MAG: hypothetical protein RSF81_08405 [Oscillospiraceae bacterium]
MDMDEMNTLMTKMAVQEEKIESILAISKAMQKSLESINSEVSDIKADNKLTKHRLDEHEKKIFDVKEEVYKNTKDVLSLQNNTESTLRDIKFVGTIFMAIATLVFGILGVYFKW